MFLGGGIWIASWVGQISWDVLGIMNSGTAHDGLAREYTDLIPSVATRLWQAVELSDAAQEWTELAKSAAWYALLLGLLSFWWNPMLQVKLERKRGRIIGKWDFYKLQATSFAIRCAAWAYIASPNSAPDPRTIKTIHYCVLFFGALVRSFFLSPVLLG